jgi:AmmeMemoRadiSam system protein B
MRKAVKQGTWYPQRKTLLDMLRRTVVKNPQPISLLVAPHAGLAYCIQQQSAVFSTIE